MSFKVGDVVAVYTDRSYDTKFKYFVVVAESRTNDNFLCVFINSEQGKPEFIKRFQPLFELTEQRTYLTKSSYIDCYKPDELTRAELQNSINQNPKNNRGQVSEDDLDLIKDLIKSNPTLTPALKKSYFYGF